MKLMTLIMIQRLQKSAYITVSFQNCLTCNTKILGHGIERKMGVTLRFKRATCNEQILKTATVSLFRNFQNVSAKISCELVYIWEGYCKNRKGKLLSDTVYICTCTIWPMFDSTLQPGD